MKNIKNKKGFTLVELVVVIAILAILAAVAIPVVSGIVNKSKTTAAKEQATEIQQAVATCYAMSNSPLESVNIITVGQALTYFNISADIVANGEFLYEPNKGKVYYILDDSKPAGATAVLASNTPIANVAGNNGLLPDTSI